MEIACFLYAWGGKIDERMQKVMDAVKPKDVQSTNEFLTDAIAIMPEVFADVRYPRKNENFWDIVLALLRHIKTS